MEVLKWHGWMKKSSANVTWITAFWSGNRDHSMWHSPFSIAISGPQKSYLFDKITVAATMEKLDVTRLSPQHLAQCSPRSRDFPASEYFLLGTVQFPGKQPLSWYLDAAPRGRSLDTIHWGRFRHTFRPHPKKDTRFQWCASDRI